MGFVDWSNYKRVIQRYPKDFVVLADTGFVGGVGTRTLKVLGRSAIDRLPMHLREIERLRCKEISRIRIACELGNSDLKTFSVLRYGLSADQQCYRAMIIETCVRLYNMRVRMLGISQITKYFKTDKLLKDETFN